MSTWKNVGMTYLKYADLCATHVRNALKEPMKTKSAAMSDMHIRIMQWEGGKRGKPGAHQLLPTCWQAVFLPVLLAPSLVACAVLERAHWARPAILQAAPVCGPDTRQLSPSPPFGGARKRSAPPAALTRCARPVAFAFAARRDRDQDGCSVILVATARSYFCGAHRCSCGGALRSARHILLSGAAAGVDAPGTRFEMGRRCVLSRFPTHASCRSRRPSRGGKKHISEKSACGVTEEPPPPGGGAATLQRRGRAGQRDGADGSRLFCFSHGAQVACWRLRRSHRNVSRCWAVRASMGSSLARRRRCSARQRQQCRHHRPTSDRGTTIQEAPSRGYVHAAEYPERLVG